MKIRNGFVSNSSTSSFICDICGEVEAGMDISMRDVDMEECENGHVYHTGCLNNENIKEKIALLLKLKKEDKVSIYEVPSKYCPLCQMIIIPDSDLLHFILKTRNMNAEEIRNEMREDFKNKENKNENT